MSIMEEVTELVSELCKGGEEIAPFIYVGLAAFTKLRKTMDFPYPTMNTAPGVTRLTIMTIAGQFIIKPDLSKPTNYVGINGRTLLDVIAERELLGL